jgi:DNA primase
MTARAHRREAVEVSAMDDPFLEYATRSDDRASGGLIPQHVVDIVRDLLPPSAVISKYVRLRRAGRELKGLSPFNRERTPSFFVNDDKRFWHDFSSNESGDVFAFVMKMEHVTFGEAVRYCAKMVGISIPDSGNAPALISAEAAGWKCRRALARGHCCITRSARSETKSTTRGFTMR